MPDPVAELQRAAARQRFEQSSATDATLQAGLRKLHKPPISVTIGYSAFLASVQEALNVQVRKATAEAINALGLRLDGPTENTVARIFEPIEETNNVLADAGTPLAVGVAAWSREAEEFDQDKWDSAAMVLLGLGFLDSATERAILDSWIRENLLLIQNVNRQQLAQLQTFLLRAFREGLPVATIEAEIARVLGVSVSRARLIARDQIGKLVGQLDRARQLQAGIEGFIWRTQADERVRPSHRALDGREFAWNAPPAIGTPGQPIQCRCTAEPILTAIVPQLAQ